MDQSTSAVPPVADDDTDDTRWALETAATLWQTGDRREALRWVRRAAEAAAENGLDDRALDLAKAGAELRGLVDIPRTLPPPPAPPAEAEEAEPSDALTVTVVSTDGSLPAKDASLVSHRAVRVAISPMPQDTEKFIVRPLAAGEVASGDASIGLLVSLAPGESPLPTGSR